MIRVVNRAMHAFILDGWGKAAWRAAVQEAGLGQRAFDLMLDEPAARTQGVLSSMAARLGRSRECLLEDFGTYLVAHPSWAPLRRLLRFCGTDYRAFLMSLDELPERVSLALPDLVLPPIAVEVADGDVFRLRIGGGVPGVGAMALGAMRGMADDYGALVLLEAGPEAADGAVVITVRLLDDRHAEGKAFTLGPGR
ncbi:heme NO-binding domain-containing protein [Tabrizicola sp. M-4]|uniref:heme NO-binding domain-containing protein n=1 Tax=Tabrizicola sp. M-4 TaxID=3055847 RepID=UPI003DA8B5D0